MDRTPNVLESPQILRSQPDFKIALNHPNFIMRTSIKTRQIWFNHISMISIWPKNLHYSGTPCIRDHSHFSTHVDKFLGVLKITSTTNRLQSFSTSSSNFSRKRFGVNALKVQLFEVRSYFHHFLLWSKIF